MPTFVLTSQSVTNPLATDPTNSSSVPHHQEHTLVNNEVAAIGGYFDPVGTQANKPRLTSASSGNGVSLAAAGSDSDISITISPKGSGGVTVGGALSAPSLALSGLTAGSLLFAGSSGAVSQDNSHLFWDNSNKRMGVGTGSPSAVLHLGAGSSGSSGAPLKLTSGTVMTTPEAGAVEYDGRFRLTESDAVQRYPVQPASATKVTADAPYTNDGYITVMIGGTAVNLMTALVPPSAPTGVSATPGDSQVELDWTASGGATSYDVYRGTTTGGESSTPLATGIAATTYTDTTASNGTEYFYKVSAVNAAGESAKSSEVSATPTAGVLATVDWSGNWDAQAISQTDDTGVSEWDSSQSSTPALVQATSGAQPTYHASGGPASGKPWVEFNGTSDGLQSNADITLGTWTAALVFKANTWILMEQGDGTNTNGCYVYLSNGSYLMSVLNVRSSAGTQSTWDESMLSGPAWHRMIITMQSSGPRLWLDGEERTAVSHYTSPVTDFAGPFSVGARDNAASLFMAGGIAQLAIVGDTVISDGDIATLDGELAARWGM